MIPVEVRDQDQVDVAQAIGRRHRFDPPERAHPPARDRVGQDADPVELDEDRRVTDEIETDRAEFLTGVGYDAFNVAGGIDAWSQRVDPGVPRY